MLTPQTFSIVTLLPRQDGWVDDPGSVQILWSDDGTTFTQVYSVTGLACTSNLLTFGPFPGGPVTHRYVKYNCTVHATGSSIYDRVSVTNQDGGGWTVAALGFASTAGDTFNADTGTLRQSVVATANGVGIALVDQTMAGTGTLPNSSRLSASRQWAAAAAELRVLGGAAVNYQMSAPPLFGPAHYLRVTMPRFTTPSAPAAGGGNSGFVA
jgi:hypothetical protein